MPDDPTSTTTEVAALEARGMTKRYGSVLACDAVDLTLRHGEIHGILGENGAGKSTLMRMLIGLALPDRGSILIEGEKVRVTDPLQAARLGIGMVHQHYSLVDALTVWENVALGERDRLAPEATRVRISEISERYGLEVDPEARVGDLSAGMRQRVEIVKCLRHGPRIIILDEPTSVLSPVETAKLFDVLREGVRRDGWAVALVSHKLHEVLRVTDRITIMRDGRVADRVLTEDADAPSLARAMVGRPVALRTASAAIGVAVAPVSTPQGSTQQQSPILEIRGATARRPDGRVLLSGLDLTVRPGEIVGVAGVEGNGQHALGDLLSSLLALDSGTVLVAGEQIPTGRAGAMTAAGVAVIPEDRHESGVVVEMSVAENLSLAAMPTNRGVIDRRVLVERAERLIAEFDIHTPGPATPVGQLSGGNQQRVLLARALSTGPRVLVASQPTRGLDVGAIEYVGERLEQAARDGIAVLLISTDLGEIAALSHRIAVIYRGSIIGEMSRAELDVERLGMLIGGARREAG